MTAPEAPPGPAFRLGALQVQPAIGRLRLADDREAHLEPRVMDLLVFLSARPGEVLTKEALREGVWRGRFVTQDALFVAISALRRALGDDPRAARFVATVPKRGYRWIGPPAERLDEPLPEPAAPNHPQLDQPEPHSVQDDPSAPHGVVQSASRPVWQGLARRAPWRLSFASRTVMMGILVMIVGPLTIWMLATSRGDDSHAPPARAVSAITEAQHFAQQASAEGFRKAVGAYSEAIALAPNLASAYAGLADTYARMVDHGFGTPRDLGPAARANARRAVELAPDASESHMAEGSVRMLFDHDLEGAAASYRRAAEIDPASTAALDRLGWTLAALGDQEPAERTFRQALTLEPTATALHKALVTVLYFGQQSEALETAAEAALRIDQDMCIAHFFLSYAYRWRDRDAQAFVAFRHGLHCSELAHGALGEADRAFETGGMPAVDRWLFTHTQDLGPESGLQLAAIAAVAGEAERALDRLEQAEHRRDPALRWMEADPAFDSLHDDDRYRRLVQRLVSVRPAG